MKRKICFIITSSIHYGRSRHIMDAIKKHPDLDLQIIVGASALLSNYGSILSQMESDGFHCDAKIFMTLEGGNPIAMAKTAGIGVTEFATALDNLRPDIVLLRADRYEVLSAAMAAAYLNIPIAHIEGGDVTGTIDESVRHAITKLSHIHFTTNDESKKRVIRMGEKKEYVFMVGSPELEFVKKNNFELTGDYINSLGVGDIIDISKPYVLVIQHPVTTEIDINRKNTEETLKAVSELTLPVIWFWPNVDAGTDEVSKAIRVFREIKQPKHIRFMKYLPPREFIGLLKKTACLVGNSSAGIKECSYLGVPVVNIGTRQAGRLRAENIIDVGYSSEEIKQAIKKQIEHGLYDFSGLYYKDNVGQNIADVLSNIALYTQKRFVD